MSIVVTKNSTSSHTVFTINGNSKQSFANISSSLAIDTNDNILVKDNGTVMLAAPYNIFTGVNIDNTSAQTVVDTIHTYYMINISTGGGSTNIIENTASTTSIEIPLLEDCILINSNSVDNQGTIVESNSQQTEIVVIGNAITVANNIAPPNMLLCKIKLSLLTSGVTHNFELVVNAVSTGTGHPNPLITRIHRQYVYYGTLPVSALSTPCNISLMNNTIADEPDTGIAFAPYNNNDYQNSIIINNITSIINGTDLDIYADIYSSKAFTTGNTIMAFKCIIHNF